VNPAVLESTEMAPPLFAEHDENTVFLMITSAALFKSKAPPFDLEVQLRKMQLFISNVVDVGFGLYIQPPLSMENPSRIVIAINLTKGNPIEKSKHRRPEHAITTRFGSSCTPWSSVISYGNEIG
jgi:hypothetical protein